VYKTYNCWQLPFQTVWLLYALPLWVVELGRSYFCRNSTNFDEFEIYLKFFAGSCISLKLWTCLTKPNHKSNTDNFFLNENAAQLSRSQIHYEKDVVFGNARTPSDHLLITLTFKFRPHQRPPSEIKTSWNAKKLRSGHAPAYSKALSAGVKKWLSWREKLHHVMLKANINSVAKSFQKSFGKAFSTH